ncbi:alanine racemase [bacterium]|nr:alanine racemase [bacterium]MBU1025956.1 alanine racemase [bacterium]
MNPKEDKYSRPLWAEVNLDNLRDNVAAIRRYLKPDTKILGVIKANAYGHGMVEIGQTLSNEGIETLGVASLEEALTLKKKRIKSEILILGYSHEDFSSEIVANDVAQTIGHEFQLKALSKAAGKLKKRAKIHLKIDTGMTRMGCLPVDGPELITRALGDKNILVKGIYTHFARADEINGVYTKKQYYQFTRIVNEFEKVLKGVDIHCSNSAAVLNFPEFQADMVRIGIALLGNFPAFQVANPLPLKPLFSLKSRIVEIKEILPSTGVGYSHKYQSSKNVKIAVIPVGYADGYSTLLSNRGEVLIKGNRYPVVGQVSMDFTTVECPVNSGVQIHDEVTLLGTDNGREISLYEMASWMRCPVYEALCLMGPRIDRKYIDSTKTSKSAEKTSDGKKLTRSRYVK